MVSVIIAADVCPIEGNRPYFMAGDADSLLHDLRPEFQSADLAIANLECPLVDQPAPILKTGPTFSAPSGCINGIRQAGIDVLCLANNHIMDHGASGLRNTMEVCARAGITTVGAGENLQAARQIIVKSVAKLRIGVLAVAEHEFSIATKNSWGANPLDLIDCVRNVNSRRGHFDYLIVLLHGSDEFLVPTPRIQDTCRFMVELGANAVIVQHPHCLGGCEEYQHGHIVYGQGALIMDEAIYRNQESFHAGFLVKLLIADDGSSTLQIVPFVQSSPVPGARRMDAERESEFRQALAQKSKAVADSGFVQKEWLSFCDRNKHDYLSSLLGHNRLLARLNRGGMVEKLLHGRMPLLRAKNIVSCETHREAIQTIFNHGLV